MKGNTILVFSFCSLFIISFLYFFFFEKGIFFYQENSSLFIYTSDYLEGFSSKPGGLLVYAGNFLTQFYFNPLYGALTLSGLLILQGIVFISIGKLLHVNKSISLLLFLFPEFVLLLLQTHYDTFVQNSLGYLIVTLWFLISIATGKKLVQYITAGLFPVLYYLTGSFAFIYIGISVIYSLIYNRGLYRIYYTSFLLFISFLTFITFKNYLFLQPSNRLLSYPLLFSDISKISAWSYLFSGIIIFFPILIRVSGMIKLSARAEAYSPAIIILILFPSLFLFLNKSYEPEYEKLMRLEKLVYERNWEEIIRECEKSSPENIVGEYYYNLSLIEKGQLCSRLFYIPQNYGSLSLPLQRDNIQMFRALYFYYAIGLTGEAHHLAFELMVQHGHRPESIKMLIKTELINGNYKIAERYINILNKTLHYRNWAEKYEKMLTNPQLISSDPELSQKLTLLPGKDFFIMGSDTRNLDLLFEANPSNIRAFESKMARLLLEKDLLEIISEVKKMKGVGYLYLPRHIEEAVVAYRYFSKQIPDIGGLALRPETETRFKEYLATYNRYQGKNDLFDRAMKMEKQTFWYYLQFSTIKMDFEKGVVERNVFIY